MPSVPRHRSNTANFLTALAYQEPVYFDEWQDDFSWGYTGAIDQFGSSFCHYNPDFSYEFDVFDDFINQKSNKTKRYPLSSCHHVKVRFDDVPPMPDYYWKDIYQGWHGYIAFRPNLYGKKPLMAVPKWAIERAVGLIDDPYTNFWPDCAITDSEYDSLSLEAFNYFSTVFPTELSVGEFTQNFTELRSLIPEIKDSILKTLSGGYLTKEFGWDNLLADLNTLSSLLSRIKDRMEYLKRTYGIPQRLGFSRHNVHQMPHGYDHYAWSDTLNWMGLGGSVKVTNVEIDFHATCWINQQLDFIDDVTGWIRAISMSFGLDNPVLAVWKVIPFSFVIDWFLDVSGHLQRWLTARPAVGWDVYDISTSVKTKVEYLVETYVQNRPDGDDTILSTVMRCEVYDRGVGLTIDRGLLDLDHLSLHQLVLLGALGLG